MDADEGKQSILEAADRWARDVMRSEKSLNRSEQALLEAVLNYRRVIRSALKIPKKIERLPPPPQLPRDLGRELVTEMDTLRYSDVPTVPTPPQGIPVVDDIEANRSIDIERVETINSKMPTKRVKGPQ